ncbi:type IV pilus modification protein PilV [Oleiagrimonas sp. C23AA]|uniref:type IV pilus modification protein PilV n=1 Tax=Oleiagrimonas sp. C23AA TaxID=2719047 RepID=UPI001423C9AB|nr:type IV pilus modification protein PilV [Oleiagrimonas sp. C23AA]NII09161.1 type IV pilus modification protein PilV [Oleiagrimonas sp. C23AA]
MSRVALPHAMRGVSLIEVLVAIVVFSVGIMGLALMQAKGLQFTKDAGSRTQAIVQVRSLADAMRANPAAAREPISNSGASTGVCVYCTDNYTLADLNTANACDVALNNADDVAKCDLARWLDRLRAATPGPTQGAVGAVTWDASLGAYRITASWSGSKLKTSDTGDVSYGFIYLP